MSGLSPRMAVEDRLRHPPKPPILPNMEKFSTPRSALVPWTANLLTAVALVSTTWWSSANRPLDKPLPAGSASLESAVPVRAANEPAGRAPHATEVLQVRRMLPEPGATAGEPPLAMAMPNDALRTVGYLPRR